MRFSDKTDLFYNNYVFDDFSLKYFSRFNQSKVIVQLCSVTSNDKELINSFKDNYIQRLL